MPTACPLPPQKLLLHAYHGPNNGPQLSQLTCSNLPSLARIYVSLDALALLPPLPSVSHLHLTCHPSELEQAHTAALASLPDLARVGFSDEGDAGRLAGLRQQLPHLAFERCSWWR